MRYKRVVFVCLANASRSIMAEAVFNMLAQNSELQDSRICARSAGIDGDWEGLKTASEAQLVMLGMGLNIRKRRTQHIDKGLVDWADVILVMEQQHKHHVMGRFPHASEKVHLISEFAGKEGEVTDPYRHGIEAYWRCADQLTCLITAILEKMKPSRYARRSSNGAKSDWVHMLHW